MTAPPEALQVTDAMVDAYLTEQRRTVEEADKFGRPNAGGLHTNTVREACRNGITAALAASPAPQPKSVAPQAPEGEKIARLYHDAWGNTYAHWLGKPDAEFADFVYTHPAKPGDSGRNRGEVVAPTTKSPATH